MKYFLDFGGHNSCSSRIFRKLYDPKSEYHIYSFEIEPSFLKYYSNLRNHTLINKAVWIEDGVMDFHLDTEIRKAGGSLIKKVGKHRHKESIQVETIDICKWIKETFSKDDTIWLKVDVEGVEYKLIPKMIEEGIFDYIDKLFLEWHWYKIGMTLDEHNIIAAMIPMSINAWYGIEQAVNILGKDYLRKEKENV